MDEPAIILITSSEDEGGAEEEKREWKEHCSSRSVDDEYRMIADLTGFNNLRAMLEAEAHVRRERREKKKKKRNDCFVEAQEEVTVVAVREEELADKASVTVSNMISENIDAAQKIVIDAEKEKEQADAVKAVETTEASKGNGVAKCFVVIDLCSSSSEENQVEPNISCRRGVEETVLADAVVFKKRRRRRRRRRKRDRMMKACEAIGKALLQKKDQSGAIMKSLGTESVGIKGNIVLRKLLRGPRYFDPPSSSSDECPKCGELHTTLNCAAQTRKKPCYLCGGLGHNWKHCRQGLDCLACKGRGHLAKHCPEKNHEKHPYCEICLRCGESGHNVLSCTTNYSVDDLKEIQCYVCKNFGHLCCVDFQDLGPTEVSCYNCGESDHLGLECTNLRGKTSDSKSVVSCYKCKEEGHSARRCRNYVKRIGNSSTLAKKFPEETTILTGSDSAPVNLYEAQTEEPL